MNFLETFFFLRTFTDLPSNFARFALKIGVLSVYFLSSDLRSLSQFLSQLFLIQFYKELFYQINSVLQTFILFLSLNSRIFYQHLNPVFQSLIPATTHAFQKPIYFCPNYAKLSFATYCNTSLSLSSKRKKTIKSSFHVLYNLHRR